MKTTFPSPSRVTTPTSFLNLLLPELWERVKKRVPGREITRYLSKEIDIFIISALNRVLLENSQEGGLSFPFALCAVGGYGRREQHPQSDVDLLFLYEGRSLPLEGVAERVLYHLWDSGFTVGHAVRNLHECIELAKKDLTIRTNLLDIRFLSGDEKFFSSLKPNLMQHLFWEQPRSFVEAKLEELKGRRERYGDTAFLLEPNIKESPGTLRDLHTLLWVGKAIFRIEEIRDLYRKGVLERSLVELLERGYDYLLYLRTLIHLHGIEQRSRGDRLTLELQDAIASFLGHSDSPVEMASEKLMRDYYEITRGIRRGVDTALKKILQYVRPRSFHVLFSRKRPVAPGFHIYKGELHGRVGEFDSHPHRLIEAFALKARYRVPFAYELLRAIEERASLLRLMKEEERVYAKNWFQEIFTHESQVFSVISEMNEFKVLGEFLPPFKHIYSRVHRDTYHTYTVDQHLLFCLKYFYDLRLIKEESEEPELSSLAHGVQNPFLLALAILTHDIGKGYGVDHSQKGAELSETIGKKLFLGEEAIATLSFLVRYHLLLTHTMQRRDISDPLVLQDLCRVIQDEEKLKMLVLLTYCDLKGVGSGVWNEWKRSLLLNLYDDLRVVLEQGDIAGVQKERISTNQNHLRKELLNDHPSEEVERFLKALPPSFFLRHRGDLGRLAFRCTLSALKTGFGIEIAPGPGGMYWVLMTARDRPGLLSLFAGILFMGHFSIMEAEGYVLKEEGFALNLFLVVHPDPMFFELPERKGGFLHLASQVVAGVRPFVPPPVPSPVRPRSRRRVRVQINDHLSREFTVVEVFCWDRPGLLYQLTDVLFRHGCTIHLARIHTEGQRVSDTFYVQDIQGGRVSLERQAKIMEDLLRIARTT